MIRIIDRDYPVLTPHKQGVAHYVHVRSFWISGVGCDVVERQFQQTIHHLFSHGYKPANDTLLVPIVRHMFDVKDE